MIYDDDINKNNLTADDISEETRNMQDDSPLQDARTNTRGVYEESEEGIAYSPNKPGSSQQMREAEKILRKEERDEQA